MSHRDRLENWMVGWDTIELCGCVLALAVADVALALHYGLLGAIVLAERTP